MHLVIKCFYLFHLVISGAFPMFLSYDYFKINVYNSMSMETKLLMNYELIPNSEFPDKNLWQYNQFVFAVDQTQNRLFTSWKTYPPRSDISCLICHNIQTNETKQGQFYNITLIALHFDFNNQNLFAIGMTRDGLSSFLWKVDQNTFNITGTNRSDITRKTTSWAVHSISWTICYIIVQKQS
jgi:hypothetical protein